MPPRNVLFILSDQHRADTLGCAGHPVVSTPNLDRLAADGLRYTQAYCQSPLCGPSRSAIMTGCYPHTCRAFTHECDALPDMPTLGSVFRQAGYATGAIGKVHVIGETRRRDLGFDERDLRYYTYDFEDYINAVGKDAVDRYCSPRKQLERFQTVYNPANAPVALDADKMFDALVVERCEQFLESHRDEPFFLWAGLEKPHPDWTAPAEYHRMYDPAKIALPATAFDDRRDMPEASYVSTRQVWCFTEDELRHCIAAYYANVSYLDAMIGRLLGKLEQLGLADDTLVVYASDHGEMLFDQGMVQKHNFFEGSAHVPLILRGPGLPAAQTPDQLVQLIDLFPTMTQLTNVAPPPPEALEGRPLPGIGLGHGDDGDDDRAAFSEFYAWGMPERMIRQGDWKYIYSHGDICQLYNLRRDPLERINLIDDPRHDAVRQRLHARLMADWEMPDMTQVNFSGAWGPREHFERGIEKWKQSRQF